MTAGRHHHQDRTASAHSAHAAPKQRRPRRTALLFCGATVATGAVMLLSAVGATATADPKADSDSVTLCHSTSSQVNPYNLITVDAAGAFDGHLGHVGEVWHSGIDKKPGWGDIIPPFTYNGEQYSLNWPDGEEIFDNDCAIPPAPPTTVTATATVTDTATATVTDTATVTNTATVTATETTTAPPVTETVTTTAPPVTETVTATETTTAPPVTETVTSTETVTNTETTTAPPVTETVTATQPVTETVTATQPVTETVTETQPVTETVTETVPVADTSTASSGGSTSAGASGSSGAGGVSASAVDSSSGAAAAGASDGPIPAGADAGLHTPVPLAKNGLAIWGAMLMLIGGTAGLMLGFRPQRGRGH